MPRPGKQTTERAKDFKGTLRQLLSALRQYKLSLIVVMVFAILSTIFNIAGPKILAKATTALATGWIARLAALHREQPALCYGDYRTLCLTNEQLVFRRRFENQTVIVAINAAEQPYTAHFDAEAGRGVELLTGSSHDFGGGSVLPPYSVAYWRTA